MRYGSLVLTSILLIASGCATASGSREHYFVCTYEMAWEGALETLKPYSITSEDKEKGSIETAWIEMEGKERSFGMFGRQSFGNKERARLTASVRQHHDVASVSVLETRQRWHARGGVTQNAMRWWPVDPSEEVLQDISNRLNSKLQEKGCSTS